MRGRKPKPVQQKIIEGDAARAGVHKLDAKLGALPKAQRGLPDPPAHVEGLAREQWFIWKRDLELMQMDYAVDAVVLEGACVNYARAIEADEILKDGCEVNEPLFDKITGAIIAHRIRNHPAVARSALCWKMVHTFASELGLSLVSRQRLSIETADTGQQVDELTHLLMGPRAQRPRNDDEDDESVN